MDNLMTKFTKSYICMDVEGSCKWFNGQMMAELSLIPFTFPLLLVDQEFGLKSL